MKKQCAAMVWRKEELCYTPCRDHAGDSGWCYRHLDKAGEFHIDTRNPFTLYSIEARAAEKRIKRETERKEFLARYQRQLMADRVKCNVCGETIHDHASMLAQKPISRNQRMLINKLLGIRVLTDEQRTTINYRLRTHDMLWAWKAIHVLMEHTPRVESFDVDAPPF